jgi:hypothetical protein
MNTLHSTIDRVADLCVCVCVVPRASRVTVKLYYHLYTQRRQGRKEGRIPNDALKKRRMLIIQCGHFFLSGKKGWQHIKTIATLALTEF